MKGLHALNGLANDPELQEDIDGGRIVISWRSRFIARRLTVAYHHGNSLL